MPLGIVALGVAAWARPAAAPVVRGLEYVDVPPNTGECDPIDVFSREWSFTIDGRASDEVVLGLELVGGGGNAETRFVVGWDGANAIDMTMRRIEEDAGSDVCLTVRTFDLAGNEAEPVRVCQMLEALETLERDGCACASGGARVGWVGALGVVLVGAWGRRRR